MSDTETSKQATAAAGEFENVSALDAAIEGLSLPTKGAEETTKNAARSLASWILKDTVTYDGSILAYIEGVIAQIDQLLSKQLNAIMHQADFLKMEGSWRGLEHLVFNTETDDQLRIEIFNISKSEVRQVLKEYKGDKWDRSPLFRKVYEEEFGMPGGKPYGVMIGDYAFDHSPVDVDILRGVGQIAAAAHCPFITSAAPTLLGLSSWQDLSKPPKIDKVLSKTNPEYAAWRSLRASEDSRYLGLTLPRFLARAPYDPVKNPIDDFEFVEELGGTDHDSYVWSNAAYAFGANVTRAFKLYGWCTYIRGHDSGGKVENLPVHTFPSDDGSIDYKCPTEIAITDRREHELAKVGLMPLSHYKNEDFAVFMGAQSLQEPQKYYEDDATANAALSARMTYLFACCRFAHYLKVMVRDKVGSFMERNEMEDWLNKWINNFQCDSSSSWELKAKKPLAAAKVTVKANEADPGYYEADFFLRPHIQLEGLTAALHLVSRLPSLGGK